MQEYKGQGIVLQGDTNNNNLFKVRASWLEHPAHVLVHVLALRSLPPDQLSTM